MMVARRVGRSLRENGVAETARLIVSISVHKAVTSVADKRLDKLLGANTFGVILGEKLGLPDSRFRYEPTAGHVLMLSLRALRLDFAEYSFVDLGVGKGRTLFYASRHPFRQVVGVEFSPMLHEEAQNNINTMLRHSQPPCPKISVHNADAAQFELPMSNLVIFMYNPFGPPVLEAVLEQARQRFRAGFKIYFVYYNPKYREVFDAADWVESFQLAQPYHLACRLSTPIHIAFYRPSAASDDGGTCGSQ
jgi:SAM-dependent methyltransferase